MWDVRCGKEEVRNSSSLLTSYISHLAFPLPASPLGASASASDPSHSSCFLSPCPQSKIPNTSSLKKCHQSAIYTSDQVYIFSLIPLLTRRREQVPRALASQPTDGYSAAIRIVSALYPPICDQNDAFTRENKPQQFCPQRGDRDFPDKTLASTERRSQESSSFSHTCAWLAVEFCPLCPKAL